ncbi:MAG: DUF3108 domain-containing protein [Lactobacillus sp.]|jgi:hypothetical protein|nr:DUF3108 domain-containing protein [Lactobacillus sp.]
MIKRKRNVITWFVAQSMAALTIFFTSATAEAFSVKHDFTVFVGIFNASMTSFEYGITSKDYFVKSNLKTNGIFNTLYPFEATYSTTGKINTNGELNTTSYKYKSKSRFKKRSKELIYDDKGAPLYSISITNDKEKKNSIIHPQDVHDTNDLQTVMARMAIQYNALKFCDSRHEIFDGRRRFDVIFKDEGKDILEKNEHSSFKGEAVKCSMYIDKLAETGDDLLWENTSDKPIYFWIMEEETTGYPFIARIEIESTPLGKLPAYTKNITVEK